MALTCWSPRSPDLTPCDYFLWGYIKRRVYVPLLRSVWEELDYRIDICRVTKGSHSERL
ncbi:hypothetical protein B7P43_G02250 [Cryptotermes secundus]|uniref:Uncharacterized protein n=1 Tax=Cryptotermes secundus TaxID=105785 RepID=A0A2J7PNH9_9NEOP|nr:hypothetical protein B7P43_G02250 [Cryptotermes secundus]